MDRHVSVFINGSLTVENGAFYSNEDKAELIRSFSESFRDITLVSRVVHPPDDTFYPDGNNIYDAPIPDDVRILPISASHNTRTITGKILPFLQKIPTFTRAIREADGVYLEMPGFTGTFAGLISQLQATPYGGYYGSNWSEAASSILSGEGLDRYLLPVYEQLADFFEFATARYASFCVVHGAKLKNKFEPLSTKVVETIPRTELEDSDIRRSGSDQAQPESTQLFFAGSIIPRKGLETLVRAMDELRDEIEGPLVLKIAGEGDRDYRKKLERMIKQKNLADSVEFLGHVSEKNKLLDLYYRSDVFVLPTRAEGFPRVIYEAMSQGTPVVCTAVESLSAALTHGVQAHLVKPDDPRALSDGIARVLGDREYANELSRNGYDFVEGVLQNTGKDPYEQIMQLIGKQMFRAGS